nr:hypothetical protein [Bacillota bacterium]
MKNLKKQVIGFIAVLAMLINTIPMAVAEGDVAFSITNPFNYSEIYQTATAGSTYLAMNMTESNVDNHPFVEYSVYVEDAGDYNLEFKTSPIVGGAYTSPATVTVNNAVITPEQTQQIDVNTRIYQSGVSLVSGENKIRFAITGYRPNTGNTGLFHVYYLKGSKINYDLLKYEAEETGSFVRNGGFANATGFIHNQTTDGSAIEAGNVWCSKTFSAPAGKYLLTWRSTLIAGTQYVSKVELTVNEQVVTAATATADGDPWYIQTAEIPLVEGSNTIKFTVTSKKNNGAGSNALFYLDYIQLERKDSAEYK